MLHRIPSLLRTSCSLASLTLAIALFAPGSSAPSIVGSALADGTQDASFRRPIVTSIAPDQEDCANPSSPGDTEDVQITGICLSIPDLTTADTSDRCGIVEAYLTTNADGTGTRVDLSNIRQVAANEISATIPVRQLTSNIPYYVFLVRCDGAVSTTYPNALGYNVTFTCRAQAVTDSAAIISSCRLVRVSGGRFVLQVTGTRIQLGAVLRINGVACPKPEFPARFISNGITTRINCGGGVKKLLGPSGATLTITNPHGAVSDPFTCNF